MVLVKGVCPHSLLSFIICSGVALCMFTASVICLSVASFLKTPVTFIAKPGTVPPWALNECFHNGDEWCRLFKACWCSLLRVYPLLLVSPKYTVSHPSAPHVILYVTHGVLHEILFLLSRALHTIQSWSLHVFFVKGSCFTSMDLIDLVVFSTTLTFTIQFDSL